MAKDSKKADIENDSHFPDKLLKEMKRNFQTFMTKLGAHVTHLCVFVTFYIIKSASKIFGHLKSKFSPLFEKLVSYFINFRGNFKKIFSNTDEFFYWLKENFEDTKVNKGFFSAVLLFITEAGRAVWHRRKVFITAFNWAAPVLSIVFMINVITGVSNLNYGISVEYNGQKLGVISEETVFDQAEKAMQKRINYVDGNEKIVMAPKLSVQLVTDSEEIVNPNQLVDKMIVNTKAEISDAIGIYIDNEFLGAVSDASKIKSTIDGILSKYQGSGVKSVHLQKNVEYKPGLYLASSMVNPDKITSLFNSYNSVDAYYTVQEDDTPTGIASKNNVPYSEFLALNPTIEEECQIGDKVLLKVAEPYMSVEVVKDISYSRSIPYETLKVDNSSIYKGNEETLVDGKEGEEIVTAEVTTLNGREVGRTITSSTVTKEPVTEKIAVGTKTPKPTKGTTITGNGQYCWPVAGGYISAYMGDGRGHKGIDIAAPKGTSIFAAESGTVIMSQTYVGYGKCIMIQHADGNITVYGHQSQLIATVGQHVEKGELIGLVGRTGQATGNHLHFEVRHNGSYLNPVKFVT